MPECPSAITHKSDKTSISRDREPHWQLKGVRLLEAWIRNLSWIELEFMPILRRQVHEMNGEQQRSFLQRLSMASNVKARWTWNSFLGRENLLAELERTFVKVIALPTL